MIRRLPHWVLTDKYPSVYEKESVTAISMVAKLYGRMQELIDDYNHFVDMTNKYIAEFEQGMIQDFDDFKDCVIKTMDDYIQTIDTKINLQDKAIADKFEEQDEKIADAIQYMKDNIVATVTALFNEALANGDITAVLGEDYDATNEHLTLSIAATQSGSEG